MAKALTHAGRFSSGGGGGDTGGGGGEDEDCSGDANVDPSAGSSPLPPQLPAVDEIAHDVELLALGVAQEIEKLIDLGMFGSQMNV